MLINDAEFDAVTIESNRQPDAPGVSGQPG
jgi:hypothetical protein